VLSRTGCACGHMRNRLRKIGQPHAVERRPLWRSGAAQNRTETRRGNRACYFCTNSTRHRTLYPATGSAISTEAVTAACGRRWFHCWNPVPHRAVQVSSFFRDQDFRDQDFTPEWLNHKEFLGEIPANSDPSNGPRGDGLLRGRPRVPISGKFR
jgi:hypothetical protein